MSGKQSGNNSGSLLKVIIGAVAVAVLGGTGLLANKSDSQEYSSSSQTVSVVDADDSSSAAETTSAKKKNSEKQTTAAKKKESKNTTTTAKKQESSAVETETEVEPQAADFYYFASSDLLNTHFSKHGSEFDYPNAEEYEKGANAVINSPDALHKTEKEDGDDIYYLPDTNEFVVVSTSGFIRTYFKPSAGMSYYERQ